jgi:hypothetical protein
MFEGQGVELNDARHGFPFKYQTVAKKTLLPFIFEIPVIPFFY